MKKFISIAILPLLIAFTPSFSQESPYLNNETYTYDQLISIYQNIDKTYNEAKLIPIGTSDIGKPIHIFVINKEGKFSAEEVKKSGKTIVLINNGIHPGEACGIDASVELTKSLLSPNNELNKSLDSVVVIIIPIYNVGGMLNRGKYSRANQNGPKEHGFRGNAKNLDLNRDFIKCDSKNAKTFTKLFQLWDPDIFIDTHTTNGSDHPYTLTLISTQKDKLNPVLSEYMTNKMLPSFYTEIASKQMEMTPYVYSLKKSPENGIKAFLETPRYSSGYAALFDCYSFITEAHVFKPFKERVEQTKAFLETVIKYSADNNGVIKFSRKKAINHTLQQKSFPIVWELDSSQVDSIHFKGFQTIKKTSEVTGHEMMFYDSAKKYESKISYYNTYKVKSSVEKPKYYIIPQAYEDVIERLKLNNVQLKQIKSDSLIEISSYYIKGFETVSKPYEHHYLHSNMKVEKKKERIQFYQGDFICSTNQKAVRYLVETLEPQSVDGFFAWNFFDAILQQKEWFSDYAFEPIAKDLLIKDPELKAKFENKKSSDSAFSKNNFAQLYFIYQNSPYYEPTVNRYPIYRID